MPVAATTLSGPSDAGLAPAATETSLPTPTAPTPTPAPSFQDSLLGYLDIDPKVLAQLQVESPTPAAPAEPTTTPAPEADTETEVSAEATPEPETPAEPEEPETPAVPASLQKRIDKLTAKNTEAKAEAEAARQELEKAKAELDALRKAPPALPPTPEQPLAHVTTLDALSAEEARAEQVREWCLENWDGGTAPDGKDGEKYHDAPTVRKIFAHFDAVLRKAVPQRRAYLASREQHDSAATSAFPFLADPQSEGSKLAEQFLANVPYAHPDARMVAAAWAEGELARRARVAAAKAPKPAAPQVEKPKPAPARALAPAPPLGSTGAPGLRSASTQHNPKTAAALEQMRTHPNDPEVQLRYMAALGAAA